MLKEIIKKKVYFIYIPLAIYWLGMAFGTSLPSSNLPKISIGDKYLHFIAFFGLGVLLGLALYAQEKYPVVKKYYGAFGLLAASLYAAVDEVHQLFIPGRQCDILDIAFDIAGAIAGILIIKLIIKKYFSAVLNYL